MKRKLILKRLMLLMLLLSVIALLTFVKLDSDSFTASINSSFPKDEVNIVHFNPVYGYYKNNMFKLKAGVSPPFVLRHMEKYDDSIIYKSYKADDIFYEDGAHPALLAEYLAKQHKDKLFDTFLLDYIPDSSHSAIAVNIDYIYAARILGRKLKRDSTQLTDMEGSVSPILKIRSRYNSFKPRRLAANRTDKEVYAFDGVKVTLEPTFASFNRVVDCSRLIIDGLFILACSFILAVLITFIVTINKNI